MLEAAYDGWAADVRAGLTSVLVAMHGNDVRVPERTGPRTSGSPAGQVEPDGVVLRDGNRAGSRRLGRHPQQPARSDLPPRPRLGEERRHLGGDPSPPRRLPHRPPPRAPRHACGCPRRTSRTGVELAYASTAHRAQGSTVDTAHALVTEEMTRESLYVASTRGRLNNSWYAATDELLDADLRHESPTRR